LELNWSTFVLEIINFLVLVWILKHFLYRPVLDVIARRRAGIEKSLADAQKFHDDNEILQARYKDRLAHWEQERREAQEQLAGDIEQERGERLTALQTELGEERKKAQVAEARHQADLMLKVEQAALAQAARFASRLLSAVAGPELETRLIDLLMEQLPALPAARMEELRRAFNETPSAAKVVSAYPIPATQREALEQALRSAMGNEGRLEYAQDPALLAGARISFGPWVIRANLQDDLKSFAELTHESH
jgi:F-type H+-transporting ATPase subunit b